MPYFDDAKDLVKHAKDTLPQLERDYEASLHDKTLKPALLVDIKNLMENLRSALDFSAHGLFSKYGASAKPNPRICFPYASLCENQSTFEAGRIEKCIPGITATRPDAVDLLKSYQHYAATTN